MLEQTSDDKQNFFVEVIQQVLMEGDGLFQFLPSDLDIGGITIPELKIRDTKTQILEISAQITAGLPGYHLFPSDSEKQRDFDKFFLNVLDVELGKAEFDIKTFFDNLEQHPFLKEFKELSEITNSLTSCFHPFVIALVEDLCSVKQDMSMDQTIDIRSDTLEIYRTLVKLKLREYDSIDLGHQQLCEMSSNKLFIQFSYYYIVDHISSIAEKFKLATRTLLAFGTAVPPDIFDEEDLQHLIWSLGEHASNLNPSDLQERARVKILVEHLQIDPQYKNAVNAILALDTLPPTDETPDPKSLEYVYDIIMGTNENKILRRFNQYLDHYPKAYGLSTYFISKLAYDGKIDLIASLNIPQAFNAAKLDVVTQYLEYMLMHASDKPELAGKVLALANQVPANVHTEQLMKAIAVVAGIDAFITNQEDFCFIAENIFNTNKEFSITLGRFKHLIGCSLQNVVAASYALKIIPSNKASEFLSNLLEYAKKSSYYTELAELQALSEYVPNNNSYALQKKAIAILAGVEVKIKCINPYFIDIILSSDKDLILDRLHHLVKCCADYYQASHYLIRVLASYGEIDLILSLNIPKTFNGMSLGSTITYLDDMLVKAAATPELAGKVYTLATHVSSNEGTLKEKQAIAILAGVDVEITDLCSLYYITRNILEYNHEAILTHLIKCPSISLHIAARGEVNLMVYNKGAYIKSTTTHLSNPLNGMIIAQIDKYLDAIVMHVEKEGSLKLPALTAPMKKAIAILMGVNVELQLIDNTDFEVDPKDEHILNRLNQVIKCTSKNCNSSDGGCNNIQLQNKKTQCYLAAKILLHSSYAAEFTAKALDPEYKISIYTALAVAEYYVLNHINQPIKERVQAL